jgi:histidyl-tRNA synthetase
VIDPSATPSSCTVRSIETRVVEPLDRLAKGGEIDKEIYVLRRLRQPTPRGLRSRASLRPHRAVRPLRARARRQARVPLPPLPDPAAWRGERPQVGRYRQFTQADIDIVGRDELAFHHDIEVMRVMVEALGALPLPPVSFQFNNRKLIQGFYRGWA